jgi:ABC-2 type transport system ATP-binding protein
MPRWADDREGPARPWWWRNRQRRPTKNGWLVDEAADRQETAMTGLSVRGLGKRYGRVSAVEDLSFDVPAGEVTGFLGPNGAGKTTTLRILLGLARATTGQALIGGMRYDQLTRPRETVGAVLEATGFHPGRSGRDHLRILACSSGLPARRVDEVLDMVELAPAADRRVGGYSMGMRQRLGLAAALLGKPQVLILDEPANGLDPAGMASLRLLLRELAGEGRTVLISSHVLSEIAQTVDRVVIISAGRMRFAGPLSQLARPGVHQAASLEDAFLRLTTDVGQPDVTARPTSADSR